MQNPIRENSEHKTQNKRLFYSIQQLNKKFTSTAQIIITRDS